MAKQLTSQDETDEEDSSNRDIKATLSLKQVDDILDKELDFFVWPRTLHFLKRFHIDTEFLHTNPDVWIGNQHYLKAKS